MGQTKIEWTATYHPDGTVTPGYTFNPWIGCQKTAAGCKFCYAERDFARKSRWANCWGSQETSERKRTSQANWRKPLAWNRQAEANGMRAKVFCASLCDVFEDNPQVKNWREGLWGLIEATPYLDWLLLTKRVENLERFLPPHWWCEEPYRPPKNIWFGVSCSTQDGVNRTMPVLESFAYFHYPMVIFISLEPLLEHVDISFWLVDESDYGDEDYYERGSHGLDWVIVGGESGPNARPMRPDWARSLRNQCQTANVPFFYKQTGEWVELASQLPDGPPIPVDRLPHHSFDDGTIMVRIGKKRAGRRLDGREWNEFPEVNYG